MNPQVYCSDKDYSHFISLTYNFDPIFFERIVLTNLEAASITNISIVADQNYLDKNLFRKKDQIKYLGKKYILEKANCSGLFHPKLMLKFSKDSAKLWMGSGNISSGGWGKNQELAIEIDLSNKNTLFQKTLKYIGKFCLGQLKNDIEDYLINYNYDNTNNPNFDIEFSSGDNSLSSIIKQRWMENTYHKLTIFTGSTDKNAAFLEWANNVFGIKEFTVVSSVNSFSFLPSIFNSFPFITLIGETESDQLMHGKFYLFEGKDKNSVIIGSPNCSRIAWLISPNQGGNVESMVIYDNVDTSDFRDILERIPSKLQQAKNLQINNVKDVENDELKKPVTRIHRVDYSFDEMIIKVIIHSQEKIQSVELEIENKTLTLKYNQDLDMYWNTYRIESDRKQTIFVEVNCFFANGLSQSFKSWINNVEEIEKFKSKRKVIKSIRNFRLPSTKKEENKIIRDIEIIVKSLLDDIDIYKDRNITRDGRIKKEKSEIEIDPSKLIYSINQFSQSDKSRNLTLGYKPFSLKGFFSDIFSRYNIEEDINSEAHIHKDSLLDELKDNNELPETNDNISIDEPEIDKEKITQGVAKQIDIILNEIGKSAFYDKCSIGHFFYAISFPLAIIIQGINHKWLKSEVCKDWYLKIINILLNEEFAKNQKGLIKYLKNRFKKEGKAEFFSETIGDGSLWVSLLSCIDIFEWVDKLELAILMDNIFQNKDIIINANPEKVAYLIDVHQFENIRETILEKALELSNTKSEIEQILYKHFDILIENQKFSEHHKGDYLLSRKVGWVKSLETKKLTDEKSIYNRKLSVSTFGKKRSFVIDGYFVSLQMAMKEITKLKILFDEIYKNA